MESDHESDDEEHVKPRTEIQKVIARAATYTAERYAGDSRPDIQCRLKYKLATTDIGELISSFLARQVKVYNGYGKLRGSLDFPREEVAELTCGELITRARACGLIGQPPAGDVWVVEVRMPDSPPTQYGDPNTLRVHPDVKLFDILKILNLSGLDAKTAPIRATLVRHL